jgi:hypothetical protein
MLITTGAFTIAQWWAPSNPLFLGSEFHWLWLAPALIACRYGVFAGFLSVGLLLALWWGRHGPIDPEDVFPKAHFLGGALLVFICGQFSEMWTARLTRARQIAAYYEARLDALTRNHYLLRLSHDRLLQDALVKPLTLRDSLAKIRDQALLDATRPVPKADEFLRLIAFLCQIEVASLHAVRDGVPERDPLAVLGEAHPLERGDPLVKLATGSNEIAHVQSEALRDRNPSRYLVCAPSVDSDGESRFFLAVERMPFMALNTESVQTMAVILGYYADGFAAGKLVAPMRQRVPEVPLAVALEISRLARVARESRLQSTIAALVFKRDPAGEAAFEQVHRARRSRDVTWEIQRADRRVLLTVMPLAGPAALEGYLIRIEKQVRDIVGIGFDAEGVVAHTAVIDGADASALLVSLLERCRV